MQMKILVSTPCRAWLTDLPDVVTTGERVVQLTLALADLECDQIEVGVTLINKDDELSEQKGKSIWVHETCGPQARAQDAEVSEGYNASKGEVLDKDPIKEFTEEEPW